MIIRSASAALAGTVRYFRNLSGESFLRNIEEGFRKMVGEDPSPEQLRAWQGSWEHLRNLFARLPEDIVAVFEYRLPFAQQRVDLLLLGTTREGRSVGVVLELKGWRAVKLLSSDYLVEVGGRRYLHPDLQAADYAGKLRYTHSEASSFLWKSVVWMYNLRRDEAFSRTFKESLCFFRGEAKELAGEIRNWLQRGIPEDRARAFLRGTYRQSRQLFQAIKDNFRTLERWSLEALARYGFAPSEEQLHLLDEITEAVQSGVPTTFLIKGSPGSGKTYLAILLLIRTLTGVPTGGVQNAAVLSFRNNRLLNTVRRVFQELQPGLDAAVRFYSTGKGYGLAESSVKAPDFRLVIYDEAQRLEPGLAENAVRRGVVTVFFYDEMQVLNLNELQNVEVLRKAAEKDGRRLIERDLTQVYRVRGGRKYHDFVEQLLRDPSLIGRVPHFTDYEFRVFSDIEEMLEALREKNLVEKAHVALVAAFTESPGDRRNKTGRTLKNLRVGYPLYSGFDLYRGKSVRIYWLMDERTQYPDFWLKQESNRLTHCASIYGCQGFEADYVGVIWGRDMVWRGGKWSVGTACEDTVGRPKSLKELIEEGDPRALPLLRNRYRIFLTRGIRGTFVFCEDRETLEMLLSLTE
ncbi:MAG: DUF2075 domain-containing protein [Aquificae bacterium]|nr:DUF2075 domain-containing protein [Aquificota bacterium]